MCQQFFTKLADQKKWKGKKAKVQLLQNHKQVIDPNFVEVFMWLCECNEIAPEDLLAFHFYWFYAQGQESDQARASFLKSTKPSITESIQWKDLRNAFNFTLAQLRDQTTGMTDGILDSKAIQFYRIFLQFKCPKELFETLTAWVEGWQETFNHRLTCLLHAHQWHAIDRSKSNTSFQHTQTLVNWRSSYKMRPNDELWTNGREVIAVFRNKDEGGKPKAHSLQEQRAISQTTGRRTGVTIASMTVEIPPDGDCGFVATERALRIMGYNALADRVTRAGFIQGVSDAIQLLQNERLSSQGHAEVTNLLHDIYACEGMVFDPTNPEQFSEWEQKFEHQNEDNEWTAWADTAHFKWLAYLHQLHFDIYVVDHATGDRLISRGLGAQGIGHITASPSNPADAAILAPLTSQEPNNPPNINLLYDCAGDVQLQGVDPGNNHFDVLLLGELSDETQTRIDRLGYTITQQNASNAPTP